MFRDVPNFKKLELRTELQMVEPKTNRTRIFGRTELHSFSLILTNHTIQQYVGTIAFTIMTFIDHFLAVLISQT